MLHFYIFLNFLSVLLLSSILPSLAQASNGTWNLGHLSDDVIRVRLASGLSEVQVQATYDPAWSEKPKQNDSGRRVSVGRTHLFWKKRISSAGPAFMQPNQLGKWKCVGQHIYVSSGESTPSPEGVSKSLILPSPWVLRPSGKFLTFQGKNYRGELWIHAEGASSCTVVNHVPLDDYLTSLVNSEISAGWEEAVLAAQGVVARTYAYARMQASRRLGKKVRSIQGLHPAVNHDFRPVRLQSHFDLEASIQDQVYEGIGKEDARVARVIQKTRNWILAPHDKKGVPLSAYYHSACGGMTTLPESVWGQWVPGFKRAVGCPFCISSPVYRWELILTSRQLSEAIGKFLDQKKGKVLQKLRTAVRQGTLLLLEAHRSEVDRRVVRIQSTWIDEGKLFEVSLSGVQFRNSLGPTQFRSTQFEVASQGSARWHFRGYGYGHGVGMCQWGAKAMAERGYSMQAILKHYYPDAYLQSIASMSALRRIAL